MRNTSPPPLCQEFHHDLINRAIIVSCQVRISESCCVFQRAYQTFVADIFLYITTYHILMSAIWWYLFSCIKILIAATKKLIQFLVIYNFQKYSFSNKWYRQTKNHNGISPMPLFIKQSSAFIIVKDTLYFCRIFMILIYITIFSSRIAGQLMLRKYTRVPNNFTVHERWSISSQNH